MTQLQLFHQLLANLQADPASKDVPVYGLNFNGKATPLEFTYAANKDRRQVLILKGKGNKS